MDYSKFISTIAFSKELNPFHDAFSIEKMSDLITKLNIDKDISSQLSFLFFILITNPDYKEFYESLKQLLESKDLVQDYYLYSLSVANHDSIVMAMRIEKKGKAEDQLDLLSFYGMMTETAIGESPVSSLADGFVDQLDFNFSLLKYVSGKTIANTHYKIHDKSTFKEFHKIFYACSYFGINKAVFEYVCFENAKCSTEGRTIKIRTENPEYEKLKAISQARIQTNMSLSSQQALNNPAIHSMMRKNPRYRQREIKTVNINESTGEIDITLSYIEYNEELETYYFFQSSSIITYYYYLTEEGRIKLDSFIRLFVVFQYVASKIREKAIENESNRIGEKVIDFNYFLFKIKFDKLIKVIENISGDRAIVIADFIRMIQNNGTDSFWERPLLRVGVYYFFCIHGLFYANILNFSELWIQDKIADFDSNGVLFEEYVKSEIAELSKRKDYYCVISPIKKFWVGERYEEIDLVWESKHSIVLAEVKNIRYPFTSRNYFEFRKIVLKAVDQIKRKSNFLSQNAQKFNDIDLSKKIIKCVITNIPFLTGLIIDDVAVIDLNVLIQYIGLGYNAKVLIGKGTEQQFDKTIFYTNEDEFSNHLNEFIFYPNVNKTFDPYFSFIESEYQINNTWTINYQHVINTMNSSVI